MSVSEAASGARGIARGTLFGGIARASTGIVTLLLGALLARLLPADQLGLYFVFLQVVRLLGEVVAYGMSNGLIKVVAIAADQSDWLAVRRAASNGARLLCLAAAGAGFAYAAAWPFLNDGLFGGAIGPAQAGMIFAIAVLRAIEIVCSAFFRGLKRYLAGVLLLGFPREAALAAVLAVYWLARLQVSLDDILSTYLIVTLLIGSAVAIAMLRVLAGRQNGDGSAVDPAFTAFLVLCSPMMVHFVVSNFYRGFDIWVLGFFRPGSEVGIYGAAIRLTLVIVFELNIVNLVIPATVASLYDRGEIKRLEQLMRAAASAGLVIALPVSAVFLLYGGEVLQIVYGPGFEAGAFVLAAITLGQGFSAACGSPGLLLQLTGHQTLMTKITLASAAAVMVGCIVVAERFGPDGVALVMASGIVLQNTVMTVYARRRVGVWTLPSARPEGLWEVVQIIGRRLR